MNHHRSSGLEREVRGSVAGPHPSLLPLPSSSQLMGPEQELFNFHREGWPNKVRKVSGKINFYS